MPTSEARLEREVKRLHALLKERAGWNARMCKALDDRILQLHRSEGIKDERIAELGRKVFKLENEIVDNANAYAEEIRKENNSR